VNHSYFFFDHASTTPCCEAANRLLSYYATESFGNPSSNHVYGEKAATAIRNARGFFAKKFHIKPEQIIFTGSGSEATNLALYGLALPALIHKKSSPSLRILISNTEHPSVLKTASSLKDLGFDIQLLPVDSQGQIICEKLISLLTPSPLLVSIHQVNNITGALLPIEELAQVVKAHSPKTLFHTDSIQAFGKIKLPHYPSSVDLISLSAHKIEGPKGVGALVLLNPKILSSYGLRPLIWGGDQENGFRSGTQNTGLIAGFHVAAEEALKNREKNFEVVSQLNSYFFKCLESEGLLKIIHKNSPDLAIPHIISLSFPGFLASPLAKFLEGYGCIVSTGSACHSRKKEPEPILKAMGFPLDLQISALRVSFSQRNTLDDINTLVHSLKASLKRMQALMGKKFL
jgi:cysteine desulfurase